MIKKLHTYLIIILLSIPFLGFSTHIVGGSLTYTYNGGSNYTVMLKLYRDCGPGAAGFPGSVEITVLGENGQPFNPSKNFTMNLSTNVPVTSPLDPCAIPPNPMPCVREGVYRTTVNNLPPNFGGYHLHHQLIARNLTLTNLNGACNCIGSSFYAFIPGSYGSHLWAEEFTLPNNTNVDNGASAWSLSPGATAPSFASVNNNRFEVRGANNGMTRWISQNIDISSCTNSVSIRADVSRAGTLEAGDSLSLFYRVNGGALIPFPTNGLLTGNFAASVARATNILGNTLQIVARFRYQGASPNSEIMRIDNITVMCNNQPFVPNNSAVFNQFPPLFLCVNQPFTFNHSASDADGDSLAYSLYTPYEGDNGVGALDPSFTNSNVAVFPTVNFLAGYTTNNPLGASPFNLDPVTGILTGTPGMIGQFVVGVKVREFRNGVYVSETLRDFQFNILNCPQPPPSLSVPDATINAGCSARPTATGITSVSATWTSVNPGPVGAYNNYLACTTGCLSNTVTPVGTPPPFVDYRVCGNSLSCSGAAVCYTFRVTFNSTLNVNIQPTSPTLCFGQTSTTITAIGSGGTPPYSYLWNSVNPSQTINVGVGVYNVRLSDASGCPPVFNSVSVTAFTAAATANAGPDQTRCRQTPLATLNGSVTGSSGGIWSGGSGTFAPNNTTLANITYSPSAAELTAGFVKLVLTTTGNGSCPFATDTVRINYQNFTGTPAPTATNVSCFGSTNGNVAINVTGGAAPHTFTWSTVPAQTTATVNNLPIGTYTVTIRDGIGCTTNTQVTISQPPLLGISSTINNNPCFGSSAGSLTVTPSGGNPPYTYSWSPGGQTTSTVTGLVAGTYTILVTDSRGCINTSTYIVNEPTPVTANITTTMTSCFGGSDGRASATASGGTAPYTYSWSPGGSTSPSVTNFQAGTYTLTVRDFRNCVFTTTTQINQPTQLTSTVTSTNKTCSYLNNGTATISASGGTAGYTYQWQPNGATTQTLNGLAAGVYNYTVTDLRNCINIGAVSISGPPVLNTNFTNINNVTCFGASNASVSASPSGGTPNYTYTWSPGGSNNATLSNIPIGTYTVTVADNNLCTATNTITVTQPTSITVTSTVTSLSCFGNSNGTISITPSGGTPGYNYFWYIAGQTTSSVSGLSAGTYSVDVRDNNNCTQNFNFTINQPSEIIPVTSYTPSTCGNSNGISEAIVSGGTAPYTYQWLPNGGTNSITSGTPGIPAGIYSVVVTDANGCTGTGVTLLSDVTGPSVTVFSVTNVTCFGANDGTASASSVGGTGTTTFSWSPIGGNGLSATGLGPGVYYFSSTDQNGCLSITGSSVIVEPPQLFTNLTSTNVSCFGLANGSASVAVYGGTSPYTINWLPTSTLGTSVNSLTAGTYSVNITDANNCPISNTISITQPTAALSVSTSSTNVLCFNENNGTASATASGGTAPYSYNWLPMSVLSQTIGGLPIGTYTIDVVDFKGCTTTSQVAISQPTAALVAIADNASTSCAGGANGVATVTVTGGTAGYTYTWSPSGGNAATATGLSQGNYFVSIADNNNCETNVSIIISSPTALTGSLSITDEACSQANGFISSQVTGGTSPYSYTWTPTGVNTANVSGINAGNYTLLVNDDLGCPLTLTATVNNISGPSIIAATPTNVSCYSGSNGAASITINQGTLPYTISWLPFGGNATNATSLTVGVYTVNVTDDRGCLSSTNISIAEPSELNVTVTSLGNVSCNGLNNGSITITPTGGTPNYSYTWSPTGNTNSISNLAPGTYTALVADANLCSTSLEVIITEPTVFATSITSFTNPLCFDATNGVATTTVNGGTAPYAYLWTTTPPQNGSTASNLGAEIYSVSITDANGCVNTHTVELTNPSKVTTIPGSSVTACFGGTATISASASGGAGNYYYVWMPGAAINSGTLTINPANASTNYTVVGYDQAGCEGTVDTIRVTVYNLTQANLDVFGTASICEGQSTTISAQTNGALGPITYNWNNNLGNTPGPFDVIPTQPTTYVVTVTNSCGVSVSDSVIISFTPPPTVIAIPNATVSCIPFPLVFSSNSSSSNPNDPITSWNWDFGDGNTSNQENPTYVYDSEGTFTVTLTVTTDAGCTNSNSSTPITINAYPSPIASFTVSNTVLNLPYDAVVCTNLSTGATIYNWSFGDGNTSTAFSPTHLYNTIGEFQIELIATTNFGCTDTARIDVKTDADLVFPNAFTPNSDGPSGGFYIPGSLDNDIFFPYGSGVIDYKFQIFDRWGELIFETEDFKQGWDGYYRGKICQLGVYIWKAYAKLNNGKEFNLSGDVTLLR